MLSAKKRVRSEDQKFETDESGETTFSDYIFMGIIYLTTVV
jgi:hypothetical protein